MTVVLAIVHAASCFGFVWFGFLFSIYSPAGSGAEWGIFYIFAITNCVLVIWASAAVLMARPLGVVMLLLLHCLMGSLSATILGLGVIGWSEIDSSQQTFNDFLIRAAFSAIAIRCGGLGLSISIPVFFVAARRLLRESRQ